MSDSVRITNFPSDNSPQRVALELMEKIRYYEKIADGKHREYYLDLYSKCLSVVRGNQPKTDESPNAMGLRR